MSIHNHCSTYETNTDTIYAISFRTENMQKHMKIIILRLEEAGSW